MTSNIRDFTELPVGIVAVTPDQFLSDLLAARPAELMGALEVQAAVYHRPPLSVAELIQQLAAVAPQFAVQALALVGSTGEGTASPPVTD